LVATQKENIRSGWENEEKIIDDVGEEIVHKVIKFIKFIKYG